MKRLLLIGFSFISIAAISQSRLSEQAGNVKTYKAITGGYSFQLTNAVANITVYSPTTVRVRVSKQALGKDESYAIDNLTAQGNFIKKDEEQKTIILYTDSLLVEINKKPFRVNFYNRQNVLLNADDTTLGISWFGNQVSCYKALHKTEKFVGLGEKTGPLNRRGNYYRHWNSDVPAYALNADPIYSTVPFFIGINDKHPYGIFFDNTHQSYFNFGGGADENLMHFGADDGEMNYYFFGGSSIPQIIKDYTELTGRTPMPAMWSLGFQQSRWGYENSEKFLDLARNFREKKLPADVIVSDIPYMDNYKVFTWDPVNFSNPKAMMDKLKAMNFDVVTIIDPGIKVENGYKQYEEALQKNYYVKYPGGKPYIGHVWPGRCVFPDFTKPDVREWWGNSFKKDYVDIGVKGFWNDMNEPAAWGREFPNVVEFGDGANKKTLFTVKNAYGSLMAKATYEGTKGLMNNHRPFVLTRAGYAGLQKYTAQWTGDNVSTDDHMLLGFRLLNSMGVSGIPYVGMDIGGFMGNPSAELFIRWMNLGIYSPLYRNHTSIDYNYREPWLFGESNTRKIRKILEQRYQILPYLYSSFYTAHTTGMPINRMLPIAYMNDDKVYDEKYQNQFMFGDYIMVCPAKSTDASIDVYFPEATTWYRLNSNNQFQNDIPTNSIVPSPIDDVPVYVKAGGIIPMQSIIQSTKESTDGILYLHVYKGNATTTFTYYEDDGDTYDYEKGSYCKRLITYDPAAKAVTIGLQEGSYKSKFNKVRLIMHGDTTYSKDVEWTNQEIKINY